MSDEPQHSNRSRLSRTIERKFESFLWHFRLVIVPGVIGLLMASSIVFALGAIETTALVGEFATTLWNNHGHLADEAGNGLLTYNEFIISVITVVDDFLVGVVLLIFGLGSYDLFVSRIDPALEQTDIRPDWLVFGSLEELKSVLGKVVLMILTIMFLKVTIDLKFEKPVDLIYLGGGIALVSLGLKLSHGKDIDKTKFTDK
ncbi:MAG: YqhA family protein [Acidobacteria bacterium]|nr:MAG: YqhA family protein [Acidobacteriota bacterium]